MFPVFGLDRERFLEHLREQARGVERIPFVCRCATVVKDATNEYTHVFLVPDEGYSAIVKLHDRLYEGPLSPHLRLDIPFIPHIGVANASDPRACKALADELNSEGFEIRGSVDALDAASYKHDRVTTIERVPLGYATVAITLGTYSHLVPAKGTNQVRSDSKTKTVRRALVWIVDALNRHGVPYQVVGGLAARAYGARRGLVDIDIYVPFDEAAGLLEELQPHVAWGPEHFVDDSWDITFMKIDYRGQRIELGDSSTEPKFFNWKDRRWEVQRVDYERSAIAEVFGVEVLVMPKDELLRYKSALGREVDVADIEQITG